MLSGKGIPLCLILGLALALSTPSHAMAATLDVSAGTDSVIYSPGDNVTVTGMVRNAVTKQPTYPATVTVAVTKGSTTVGSGSYSTDSDGKFESDAIAVSSTGTHTITAAASSSGSSGGVTGYFDVETEKRYTLSTDQYTYSPGDTATITLEVVELPGETPAAGESIALKIKRANGTVEQTSTLTTNSNGRATATFTVPGYDEYVAVAGKGLAMAVFEAPSFNMRVSILGSDGKKKDMFDNSGQLKVRTTTTKVSSSTGTVTPVRNVDVTVYVRDISGSTLHTFNTSTETSDGVYQTGFYSLSSLSNGDYYVEVKAEKGSSSMRAKSFFSIKSLRVDLVPIGEMEGVMSFLRDEQVSMGLFIMNLGTGDTLTEDEIYGAEIVGCKDSKGKNCLPRIPGSLNTTVEGFREFPKLLQFTAPNKTGEYFIEVRANTSAGSGRGGAHVFVQNVIAFSETLDQFGSWRWRYGPGENVSLRLNAYSGGYSAPVSVSSVEVLEVRNDSWDDVTDSVIPNATRRNATGPEISFSAPSTSGWYSIKLRGATSQGWAYSGAHFEVQLYDLWADTMDGPLANSSWDWRFGASDNVYFHINAYDLGGTSEDNRINSSSYVVDISSLRYEETGKRYTNLNVTPYADDSWGRPVLGLDLSSLSLSSGHYSAQIEMTDMDGNKGYFDAWFKISNFDVWTETTTNSGEQGKWRFGPSENVTIKAHCSYFNGTSLPDGTSVEVEDLMYAQKGPPIPVPSDVWQGFSSTTTSGEATVRVRPATGQSLSQGHYMVMLNVTPPGSGTSEMAEAWFEVSAMDAYGWAQPPYAGTGQNITIMVTANKIDGTTINTTLTLAELRDASTWSDVKGRLDSPPATRSSSQSTTNFNFSVSGLSTGNYEAVIRVDCPEIGAKSDVYAWFSVQNYDISGEFVDNSKRVYAPGEDVEMYVTVMYPNGSYMGGQSVRVYQLVDTDSWPWRFEDATMVGTPDPTGSSSGRTKVTFKAPSSSGRYRPMVNVSGELQTDPWMMPDFEVRSADVRVSLLDQDGNPNDEFGAGSRVQVKVDVSNPTGGAVSLSSIALRYRDIDTDQETSLQTMTTNLGSTNRINFTAPSDEGEYVLFVSVTDNTTNNVIVERRWFQVETFDVNWWMDGWSVSPGDNATVNFDGRTPSGSAADFTVGLLELRDMWTWENASGYSIGDGSPLLISGTGSYNISTANLTMGEYEAVLCIYNASQGCLESSQRHYVGFSIETYEIYSWPMSGSFTTEDNVHLAVEVNDNGPTVPDDVELLELRDTRTWTDVTSLITTPENNTEGSTWILNFPAGNLSTGEYSARVNVTYSGESRTREIWFRISDYELRIDTIPSTGGQGGREFSLGQEVTFNVSVIPAPSSDTPGKLILKDDMSWQDINSSDVTINSTTGFATQAFTFNEPGFYTLIAQVGDAEEFLWFEVDAFDIFFNHEMSEHQLEPGQLLNMTFNITYPNGTEFSGDINITCANIRKTWDWSPVPGTQDLEPRTVTASLGSWESYNLTLPGGIGSGEYEAELEFSVGGISTKDHFWFEVRTKRFDAWTSMGSYEPGQDVSIRAQLAYANWTPMSGVNVTVEEVMRRDTWQPLSVSMINQHAITGASGNAMVNFTLPSDVSGSVDVRLSENSSGESRWLSFDVNSYEISVYRPNNKWLYLPGEMFDSDVYVSRSGTPQSGVNISVYVWKEGTDWSPGNHVNYLNPGDTDTGGYMRVNFTVPSDNSHYEVEILADSGAARQWEGFDVSTFIVDAWVDGNISDSDMVSAGEGLILTVYAKSPSGSAISGANVSMFEVRRDMTWEVVPATFKKNNQFTDSSGRAELKLDAPSTPGQYIVRLNVTHNDSGNVSSMIRDAWFRVSQFSTSVELVCPDDAPSNCDPNQVPAGGSIIAQASSSGPGLQSIRLCLRGVKSMWTGVETTYDLCTQNSSVNNASYTTVEFSAPQDYGDYDARFELELNTQSGTDTIDEYRWFKVEGDSSGMMMNGWIEPHSPWAGNNATAYVEVWDSTWQPADLSSCQVELTEMRDMNWNIVRNQSQVSQWPLGVMGEGGMGPPEAYLLVFEVPASLSVGDYEARIEVSCPGNTTLENFMHFRVPAFQVSSLMKETVEDNQTLEFWFRVTDNNGNPVTGTVYKDRLMDQRTWNELEQYNEQLSLSSQGEISGNITSPSSPGEYILELRVQNNSVTQQMQRWFRIMGMEAKVTLDKSTYYPGEHPSLTIMVNDTNGNPIEDASVNIDIFSMTKGPPEPDGDDNGTGEYQSSSIMIYNHTDSNGYWVIGNLTAIFEYEGANFTSGDYMVYGHADEPDYGWADFQTHFVKRTLDVFVLSGSEYLPGENVSVNITVLNQSGSPVNRTSVTVEIESMDMGQGGEDDGGNTSYEDDAALAEDSGFTDSSGQFNATLQLPSWGNITGPAMLLIDLEGRHMGMNISEESEFMLVIHDPSSNVNMTMSGGPFSPGEMIDVQINANLGSNLAVAPFVQHMSKTGNAIPAYEVMGGGPGSGKENFYENALFFNSSGSVHMKILAQSNPGNYSVVIPLFYKNSTSMMMEEPVDVIFQDYMVT